jgi:hypothetical protein
MADDEARGRTGLPDVATLAVAGIAVISAVTGIVGGVARVAAIAHGSFPWRRSWSSLPSGWPWLRLSSVMSLPKAAPTDQQTTTQL